MTEETTQAPSKRMSSVPIFIGLGLIIAFGAIFLFEFLQLSRPSGGLEDENVSADSYMDIVPGLLVDADPERGKELARVKGCDGCHSNGLAPYYSEIHQEAGNRRPPMTAAAYLYESITYPEAFKIRDYPTIMPRFYLTELTEQEIGDLIAFLLSPLAETP